jgi:DNA replicative helicase MCM subunit Mcm2 (Cdc46/Mcm family)
MTREVPNKISSSKDTDTGTGLKDKQAEAIDNAVSELVTDDIIDDFLQTLSQDVRTNTIDISITEVRDDEEKAYDGLLRHPREALLRVRHVAETMMLDRAESEHGVDPDQMRELDKDVYDVRFVDPTDEMVIQPSKPKQIDIGNLVAVRGRIANYSQPSEHFETLVYECLRCGTTAEVPQTPTGDRYVREECPGCERQGAKWLEPLSQHKDNEITSQQRLVVEEVVSDVDNAGRAEQIDYLQMGDTRCGPYQMGAEADVIGILEYDFDRETSYLEGWSVLPDDGVGGITVSDSDREEIQDLLNAYGPLNLAEETVAPHIVGHEAAKRSVIISMVSSADERFPPLHSMLVGDKGTGKSEIADDATKIAPRGRFLDSAGTTVAGLKGSVQRDETGQRTRPMIAAGTLAKFSNGVVAMDEIDQLQWDINQIKTTIEKGIVSIDKDGMSDTMQAQTSIVATANPTNETDTFDPLDPLDEQVPVLGAVGDRFDFAYPFVADPEDDATNMAVAEAIGQQFLDESDTDDDYQRVMSVEMAQKWVHLGRSIDLDWGTHHEENMDVMRRVVGAFTNDPEVSKMHLTTREKRGVMQIAGGVARMRLGDAVTPDDMRTAMKIVKEMKEMWDWDMQGSNDDGNNEKENSGSESGNQSGGGDDTHSGGEAESEDVKQTTMDYDGEAMAADLAQTDGGSSSVDTSDVSPLAELKPELVQEIALSLQTGVDVGGIVNGMEDLDDTEHDRVLVEAIAAEVERFVDLE